LASVALRYQADSLKHSSKRKNPVPQIFFPAFPGPNIKYLKSLNVPLSWKDCVELSSLLTN
jgi:hypothetical protein